MDAKKKSSSSTSSLNPLQELDAKMCTVLDNKDLNAHDKAMLYSQYLQSFFNAVDNSKKPGSLEIRDAEGGKGQHNVPAENSMPQIHMDDIVKPDPLELEIMEHIPKLFANRARQLIQKLKLNPAVDWTPSG